MTSKVTSLTATTLPNHLDTPFTRITGLEPSRGDGTPLME
jgi:hypothetical protein